MFDEPDDEVSGGDLPIHPDDRLWRHPSEIGPSRVASGASGGAAPTTARSFWSVAVVAGLAGAAVAVTALAVTGSLSPRVIERGSSISTLRSTAASSVPSPKSVKTLAAEAAAVVVLVEVASEAGRRSGSGVALRSDGILITSAALVKDATTVKVTLADGRSTAATVVGRDSSSGVAVLRVMATGLTAARAATEAAQPGDTAVAVGRATAAGPPWVTAGVVSSLEVEVEGHEGTLWGMIETDRPVPARADGGALVGADGSITGICLAVQADGPLAPTGTGYAVPIDVAAAVAADLLSFGRVRRAWLGVEGTNLADSEAEKLGVAGGALLSLVKAGSPAADGGLRAGDVVTKVASVPIRSMAELQRSLTIHRPGQQVSIIVTRGRKPVELRVTLAEADQ